MNLLKKGFVSLIEIDFFILALIFNNRFIVSSIMTKTGNSTSPKHQLLKPYFMKKIVYLFVFQILFSIGAQAQGENTIDLKELDKYYAKMVADWDIPSASIGIVKDGELIFTGNYGVMEVGKKMKSQMPTPCMRSHQILKLLHLQ